MATQTQPVRRSTFFVELERRFREFTLIGRDPILTISLVVSGFFLLIFVVYPIYKTTIAGFFNPQGQLDLQFFGRYFDAYYGPLSRRIFLDTLVMGMLTATCGTLLGFIFAYAMVRCNMPGHKLVHQIALVPTVSPPFALALAAILLLGRSGLITHRILGIQFVPGMNDIYGMDGLVFVQVITFFSVSYLMLSAMLERLDASMEEAAASLGASRWTIFRTVTLPLLIPGTAGAFLLLFVESLADLGNPLFISGNVTVLSAQIFLAIIGEYDYQKAAALSLVLLLPTLVIFLIQRYYVNRRSYISVTGKPTGGRIVENQPAIRWTMIGITYFTCLVIIVLYLTIFYGSFCTAWGTDFSPTLRWWQQTLERGVEAIFDTTFLSALATPLAVLMGMVIAFLVVRKRFSGKEALDFTSNLGGAVPGTILGMGFVLAFNTPKVALMAFLYAVLAIFFVQMSGRTGRDRLIIISLGTVIGVGLSFLDRDWALGLWNLMYLVGGLVLLLGLLARFAARQVRLGNWLFIGGALCLMYNLVDFLSDPIATLSRSMDPGFWSSAIFQISDYLKVFFQLPPALVGIAILIGCTFFFRRGAGRYDLPLATAALALACALIFTAGPLALTGTPFIIIAAYMVRSLPASVRAGVAALHQIDPSIEEASNILGADAQVTFRKVTLPLITPALLAGLIFSFTRHMTSLSAIIFLVTARWRIVTASVLSEWEQGGVSIASAYSTVIIVIVLVAIGLINLFTRRFSGIDTGPDLPLSG
jgi:iron(III) transport system permease protein